MSALDHPHPSPLPEGEGAKEFRGSGGSGSDQHNLLNNKNDRLIEYRSTGLKASL